ncbi:hypothetical protein GCWU000325_01007 [Alloprevotella tannerae ATCC 51259]|uniref:Uncharacterized protein n=1 Tax=Alloprevotella tannerae ATCC 51259 TaxID=626522 RepID=C9LFM3_9BACT|nr:hypothetical protein GCWU000325_01007 [Alloprevotella tannerae ATCC 51259]
MQGKSNTFILYGGIKSLFFWLYLLQIVFLHYDITQSFSSEL